MNISSYICSPDSTSSWLQLFCSPSPSGENYVDFFASAVIWTLELSVLAWIFASVLGILIGLGLTSQRYFIKKICATYVELFRNIPLLVQLFLWYYVIPQILPDPLGSFLRNLRYPGSVFFSAALCLGLFTSSRIAVQLSSGIRSLPRGQSMAATALGLTRIQMYRYVLLPVAFRIILPPLTSEMTNLVKNSSVAYVIGLMEITGVAASMAESTFQTFPAYICATLLYVIINILILFIMNLVERFVQIPGFVTSK